MSAIFDELAIERMGVSDGALRTGVLYDLLGRANQEDMREATVREFMQRYHVEEAQASRVAALATQFWRDIVASAKEAPDPPMGEGPETAERLVLWAALLHEIGRSMSSNGYHKHSAYILSNADMPGFSKREQSALATIVLGHNGKLPKMRDLVTSEDDWRLVLCLRLAALLCRSRNDVAANAIRLRIDRKVYALQVPQKWLESSPLTEYDLRQEAEEWRRLGRELALEPIAG
jgi:exopolyphosphatase/guanosine-5'-triphosphate,3'-diphosphate pyrophosphatase